MPQASPQSPNVDPERRAAVQRLHRTIPVIDGHCDAARDRDAGEPRSEASPARRVDLARVGQGGLSGLVLALGVRPSQYGGPAHAILRQYETLMAELDDASQPAALCTSAEATERAHAAGRLAVILGLDGGEALEGDLDLLHTYYHLGVRIIAPVWWRTNELGGGASDDPEPPGLTPLGRQVVREMGSLGMLLDVAHLPERGFWDALECADGRPVICSHARLRGAGVAGTDAPGDLSDEQVKALAGTGGVLGIDVARRDLNGADPALSELARSFARAADLVGAEHVGFGNGCGGRQPGAWGAEVSGLPRLTSALLDGGFTERALLGILGGNFLRVFRAAWNG